MTNQVFYAKKGEGSYLNESELSVSSVDNMDEVYMVTDGYGSSRVHHHLADTTLWIQRPHAAAYSIASVAAGWADFGILGCLSVWDVATGILLVREAGGEIVPVAEEQDIFDGGFFATNGDGRIENTVRSSLEDSISSLTGGE
jgi:myo-inositol-1(or 4)-monophosphatase